MEGIMVGLYISAAVLVAALGLFYKFVIQSPETEYQKGLNQYIKQKEYERSQSPKAKY